MLIALVPKPAARRAPRANPLSPAVALGAAAVITLAFAGTLLGLAPARAISRDDAPVGGPVRLPAVQVVASR